jgi:hypothetical protein
MALRAVMYDGDFSWRCFRPCQTVSVAQTLVRGQTYRDLVHAHLEFIILAPDLQGRVVWDRDCTLIDLPQSVHLLHVLPTGTTEVARTRLEHLEIIKPQPPGADVNTNTTKDELVCVRNGLTILTGLVSSQIEAPTNKVNVRRVQGNIGSQRNRLAKQNFNLVQLVELGLKRDKLDPLLALDMLAGSCETQLVLLTAVGKTLRKRSKAARASSFLCRLRCSSIRLSHASMSPRGSSATRSSRIPMRS